LWLFRIDDLLRLLLRLLLDLDGLDVDDPRIKSSGLTGCDGGVRGDGR
jgi:hypothetical protein